MNLFWLRRKFVEPETFLGVPKLSIHAWIYSLLKGSKKRFMHESFLAEAKTGGTRELLGRSQTKDSCMILFAPQRFQKKDSCMNLFWLRRKLVEPESFLGAPNLKIHA